MTEENNRIAPGAMAMTLRYWSSRLAAQTAPSPATRRRVPEARQSRENSGRVRRTDERRTEQRTERRTDERRTERRTDEQRTERRPAPVAAVLFTLLSTEPDGESVLAGVRRYLTDGGPVRLHDELRKCPSDSARAIRRALRPSGPARRTVTAVPADWQRGPAGAAVRLARAEGRALVTVRMAEADRAPAAALVRAALEEPPEGVRLLLINDVRFQENNAAQVSMEFLVVRQAGAQS